MIDLSNAMVESISTRQDGSLKIVLGTQELSDGEMKALFSSYAKSRAEERGSLVEVRIDEKLSDQPKSLAQRLRAVLYVYWEQQMKEKYKSFENFYHVALEGIIGQYKEKLEPEE